MTIKIEGLTPSQTLRHIQNFICEDTAPQGCGFTDDNACLVCQNKEVCDELDELTEEVRKGYYTSSDIGEPVQKLLARVRFNDILVEVVDNGKV